MASLAASLRATTSASQLLSAMLGCVRAHDVMRQPCTKMQPPDVLRRDGPAAQLLSENTLISSFCS
eukprot:9746957-Heterocapsa_arctica.AAC.1